MCVEKQYLETCSYSAFVYNTGRNTASFFFCGVSKELDDALHVKMVYSD